jgi:hypothetical protein
MIKLDIVFISEDPYYLGTLTKGKIYGAKYDDKEVVYSSTGYYYELINDIDIKQLYYYGMFKTLSDWREEQISKITEH